MGYESKFTFSAKIPAPTFEGSAVARHLTTALEEFGVTSEAVVAVLNADPVLFKNDNEITLEKLSHALRRLSGYSDIKFSRELFAKFYEWRNVFTKLSWEYPTVEFYVHVVGEDGAEEKARFIGGQVVVIEPVITWPDFPPIE